MKNKGYVLALLSILLISCSTKTQTDASKIFCFDTFVDIKFFAGTKDELKEVEGIFSTYDKLSDNYQERDVNNVYTINQTNDSVTIDEKLYKMLKTSFEVQSKGADYFNPLCGSLAKKWKEALNNNQVLGNETIASELEKINTSTVTFGEDNTVYRSGEAEIDLGGIAKGYTLDIVKTYLEEKEIKQYLINAGSSSILLGEKNTSDGLFTVGLKDVTNAYIKAKNCFVSTSSISEQSAVIDGVTYSHIINPVTGSAVSVNDAVIVISDDGYLGDALSTSMMMNTVEEIKNIESEQNVKAIVIKDGSITYKNDSIEVLYH